MAALSPASAHTPTSSTRQIYTILAPRGQVGKCSLTQARTLLTRNATQDCITEHLISPKGRLDCKTYTEKNLTNLAEAARCAIGRTKVITLDFTNNKAVTDFQLLQLTSKFPTLETVLLEGTAVSEDLQDKTRAHFIQIRAATTPFLQERALKIGGSGKVFIDTLAKLKDPTNPQTPFITGLSIEWAPTFTDEDLEAIIPNLIGLKELHITLCPKPTQLPNSLAQLEHLERVTCTNCCNIKAKPADLRDDIEVSIIISTHEK